MHALHSKCSDGFYAADEGWHYCAQCSSGKYSNDGVGHVTCTDAPNGGYAYGLEQGGYTICGKGKYSTKAVDDAAGPTVCDLCPKGKYIADDGNTLTAHDNKDEDCDACEAGKIAEDPGSR